MHRTQSIHSVALVSTAVAASAATAAPASRDRMPTRTRTRLLGRAACVSALTVTLATAGAAPVHASFSVVARAIQAAMKGASEAGNLASAIQRLADDDDATASDLERLLRDKRALGGQLESSAAKLLSALESESGSVVAPAVQAPAGTAGMAPAHLRIDDFASTAECTAHMEFTAAWHRRASADLAVLDNNLAQLGATQETVESKRAALAEAREVHAQMDRAARTYKRALERINDERPELCITFTCSTWLSLFDDVYTGSLPKISALIPKLEAELDAVETQVQQPLEQQRRVADSLRQQLDERKGITLGAILCRGIDTEDEEDGTAEATDEADWQEFAAFQEEAADLTNGLDAAQAASERAMAEAGRQSFQNLMQLQQQQAQQQIAEYAQRRQLEIEAERNEAIALAAAQAAREQAEAARRRSGSGENATWGTHGGLPPRGGGPTPGGTHHDYCDVEGCSQP